MNTTLTVEIVTGASWYRGLVGYQFNAQSVSGAYFATKQQRLIDKNHAIVTAVHYEDNELPEHETAVLVPNGGRP